VKKFSLPYRGFGFKNDERVIEIPWALSLYANEKRILEVGITNITDEYENALLHLPAKEIHGIDVTEVSIKGKEINKRFIFKKEDIRKTSYRDSFFDLIFCISTIEHIGRDNDSYTSESSILEEEGDFKAINEMRRILAPKGKLVLTVPFGKAYDYGWFVQYDDSRLQKLIKYSGLEVLEEDYFRYDEGWMEAGKDELREVLYKDNQSPAAAGIACLCLEKS
jgi:SAM-dependent methyltransferase